MTETKDTQHGTYDPVSGVDMKYRLRDNVMPHERAQWAVDVRADCSPDAAEEFPPEALRREPAPPPNKRTGRNPCGQIERSGTSRLSPPRDAQVGNIPSHAQLIARYSAREKHHAEHQIGCRRCAGRHHDGCTRHGAGLLLHPSLLSS